MQRSLVIFILGVDSGPRLTQDLDNAREAVPSCDMKTRLEMLK